MKKLQLKSILEKWNKLDKVQKRWIYALLVILIDCLTGFHLLKMIGYTIAYILCFLWMLKGVIFFYLLCKMHHAM